MPPSVAVPAGPSRPLASKDFADQAGPSSMSAPVRRAASSSAPPAADGPGASRQAALESVRQTPNPFARGLPIAGRGAGLAEGGEGGEEQRGARGEGVRAGAARGSAAADRNSTAVRPPPPTPAQQAKIRQAVLGMTPTEQARANAGDEASSSTAAGLAATAPQALAAGPQPAPPPVIPSTAAASVSQGPSLPTIAEALIQDAKAVVVPASGIANPKASRAGAGEPPPAAHDGVASGSSAVPAAGPGSGQDDRTQAPSRQRRQACVPRPAADEAAMQALKRAMRRPQARSG